jgi:hypothetical protein
MGMADDDKRPDKFEDEKPSDEAGEDEGSASREGNEDHLKEDQKSGY